MAGAETRMSFLTGGRIFSPGCMNLPVLLLSQNLYNSCIFLKEKVFVLWTEVS